MLAVNRNGKTNKKKLEIAKPVRNIFAKSLRFTSLFSILLVGCSADLSVKVFSSKVQKKSLIQGKLLLNQNSMFANSCPTLTATLHSISVSTGEFESSTLASGAVKPDGSFALSGLNSSNIKIENSPNILYGLKVSGCDVEYYRPVTGYSNQDISYGSWLLGLIPNLKILGSKSLTSLSRTEAESIVNEYNSLNSSSLSGLLDTIIGDASRKSHFIDITNVSPETLKDQPPRQVDLDGGAILAEMVSEGYTARYAHWNDDYNVAYEWHLNGELVGSAKNFNFITNKNSQGNYDLYLRVGVKNHLGALDSSKLSVEKILKVKVQNTFPPVSPAMSLVGDKERNYLVAKLNIALGVDAVACETFSSMAITEDALVPPVLPSAFNVLCTDDSVLTVDYNLTPIDGLKTLSLWSRDSAGNVSAVPSTVDVILDRTPPLGSLSLAAKVKGGAATPLQFSFSDVLTGVSSADLYFAQDGMTFAPVVSLTSQASPFSWTAPSVDTAASKFRMVLKDGLGNQVSVDSNSFIIDSTPPNLTQTVILSGTVTNTNSVTMGGACEGGFDIFVSGAEEKKVSCVSGAWSFNTSKSQDGTYTYIVRQTDDVENEKSLSISWVRNTVPPNLTIQTPDANSRFQSSVNVSGTCEANISISFSGTGLLSNLTSHCAANGTYTTQLFFSDGDGNKTIQVSQTNLIGNTASVSRTFIRDTTPPIISQNLIANPIYTKTNTVTWGGGCEAGADLNVKLPNGTTVNIPCSSGNWTYSAPVEATDSLRTYVLTQVDEAGNSASMNLLWERDTVPPVFGLSSAANVLSASDTANFSGFCETGISVLVTGDFVADIPCVANSWSYTTSQKTVDGEYNLTFKQIDRAGNATVLHGTWERDTALPNLTIASKAVVLSNLNSVTFSGSCDNSIGSIEVSGSLTDSVACTGGAWNYTYSNVADGIYTMNFKQSAVTGVSTTVTGKWTRDTLPPTFESNSFVVNEGDSTTYNRYVKVSLKANDALSSITDVCLKYDDSTKPSTNANCWYSGFAPSKNIHLTNMTQSLGMADKSYAIYGWVRDGAGNISSLTAAGAGSVGTDRASITLDIGVPPEVEVVSVNSSSFSDPIGQDKLAAPAGSTIYIYWRASSQRVLPVKPISLSFTTDGQNFTAIATDIANTSHSGCTASGKYTGCYVWTSPTNDFLKMRLKVTDIAGQVVFGNASPMNIDNLRILAGKTEMGTGQSLKVNTFAPYFESPHIPDSHSFVVTREGEIFVRDMYRGILRIDPVDGVSKVFIPKVADVPGVNGPVSLASVREPMKIILDRSQPKQKMYIYDWDTIRVVDLNTNVVTNLIGGGEGRSSGTLAADFKIHPFHPGSNWDVLTHGTSTFMAMPNGDVFFQEVHHRMQRQSSQHNPLGTGGILWWYKKSDGKVYRYAPYGSGLFEDQARSIFRSDIDISKCQSLSYWPDIQANGTFDRVGMVTHMTTKNWALNPNNILYGMTECYVQSGDGEKWMDTAHYAQLTGEKIDDFWTVSDSFLTWAGVDFLEHLTPFLGLNNKMYMMNATTNIGFQVYEFDRAGKKFERVFGTQRGHCSDGTLARDCNSKVSSVFVNEIGQVYIMDRGLIRMIDESGRVITIAGASPTDSDGPALETVLGSVISFHVRSNGMIIFADQVNHQFREIEPTVRVKTISNGAFAWAHETGGRFAIDPNSGDIFHHNNNWQVAKFQRSSAAFGASGAWNLWVGHGTQAWDAPETEGQSNIDFIASNEIYNPMPTNPEWNAAGAWIPPYSVLFDGDNLLVWITKAARKYVNGAPQTELTAFRPSLLSFDMNKNMRRIAGKLDSVAENDVMEVGPNAANQTIYASEWGHRMLGPYFDPASNPRRYFTARHDIRQIYEIVDGGGISILTETNQNFISFSYRRKGSEEYIYYCGINGKRIHRRHVGTGTEITFMTKIPGLTCTEFAMQWSETSQSIVFAFTLNGMAGIAEFIDP